jgi:hypothetical protein
MWYYTLLTFALFIASIAIMAGVIKILMLPFIVLFQLSMSKKIEIDEDDKGLMMLVFVYWFLPFYWSYCYIRDGKLVDLDI